VTDLMFKLTKDGQDVSPGDIEGIQVDGASYDLTIPLNKFYNITQFTIEAFFDPIFCGV